LVMIRWPGAAGRRPRSITQSRGWRAVATTVCHAGHDHVAKPPEPRSEAMPVQAVRTARAAGKPSAILSRTPAVQSTAVVLKFGAARLSGTGDLPTERTRKGAQIAARWLAILSAFHPYKD